jgi:hypothetical protein
MMQNCGHQPIPANFWDILHPIVTNGRDLGQTDKKKAQCMVPSGITQNDKNR